MTFPLEGGCTCRAVRYRMLTEPMIVHCCHCRWCQRETGSAFVLNAMIETERVELITGATDEIVTPSNSGKGQKIHRCPTCKVAVWSHYPGGGPKVAFVRAGTADDPDALPPDVHIYTMSKQPWVVLPPGARAFSEYYNSREVWPAASLERRSRIFGP